jgi:hypothetical protein
MRLSDEIVRGMERRVATSLGKSALDEFRKTLGIVVDLLARPPDD